MRRPDNDRNTEAEARAPRDDGHLPDQAAALSEHAVRVLAKARRRGLTFATAESCTGGLLASLLTDQDGFGRCFDRGFVTYTDEAKCELLGIDRIEIERHGAVSAEIAAAMARGALARSAAGIALAITGFAGPAGPDDEVGLVHLACTVRGGSLTARECHFGPLGRERIRGLAVQRALEMIDAALDEASP
ncbi:MAG: CinA family protein [Sphingomonadales bacterium]|nr:CinA family protein [Sphingomonadales bacterium]